LEVGWTKGDGKVEPQTKVPTHTVIRSRRGRTTLSIRKAKGGKGRARTVLEIQRTKPGNNQALPSSLKGLEFYLKGKALHSQERFKERKIHTTQY